MFVDVWQATGNSALGWLLGNSFWPPPDFETTSWLLRVTTWVMFAIIIWEIVLPYRRYKGSWLSLETTAYFALGAKVSIFTLFVGPAIAHYYGVWQLPSLQAARYMSPMLVLLISMLAITFVDYWTHRCMHRVPLFWHIHKIHHAPTELNWATRFHNHFGMEILQAPIWTLVSLALGASFAVPYVGTLLLTIDFFQHANIRVRFGWLNYLISTPEVHRFHHSTNPAHYDTNFGGTLLIWDHVFGTFHFDRNRPATEFGLPDVVPNGFVAQQIAPLKWILNDLLRLKTPSA